MSQAKNFDAMNRPQVTAKYKNYDIPSFNRMFQNPKFKTSPQLIKTEAFNVTGSKEASLKLAKQKRLPQL